MSKSSRQPPSTLELKPSYINDVRLEMDHPPFQVQAEFHDSILNLTGVLFRLLVEEIHKNHDQKPISSGIDYQFC